MGAGVYFKTQHTLSCCCHNRLADLLSCLINLALTPSSGSLASPLHTTSSPIYFQTLEPSKIRSPKLLSMTLAALKGGAWFVAHHNCCYNLIIPLFVSILALLIDLCMSCIYFAVYGILAPSMKLKKHRERPATASPTFSTSPFPGIQG